MRWRNFYLSLLLSLILGQSYAQSNEGAIWYFGNYAGLTWCTLQPNGDPMYLMDSQLTTNEGVATIANGACELVFYTDGIRIWDALHNQMPNTQNTSPGGSLLGDPSSTQSGVIVPKPLDPNTFYVFAVDDNIGVNGLTYSRVDMTLNGGMGDVDPMEKNVPLFTPSTEKITAVAHANGLDIWVITHEWNNNTFRVYLVTTAGVDIVNYVSSSVGTAHTGSSGWTRGYQKASPSGNKVVCAVEGGDFFELFDFDNSTGILSNPVYISGQDYYSCYGVEFSDDEHYLYGSERWGTPLRQYDITLPSAAIAGSEIQIATLGSAAGGALQLAIDQKIYLARNSTKYLGRINEPTELGMLTEYVDQGVMLGPDLTSAKSSREGLPTFITSFFVPAIFEIITNCENDTAFFVIPNPQGLTSASWNFNYPTNDPNFHLTSSEDTVFFMYECGGSFDVQLITNRQGVLDTTVQTINFAQNPDPYLGPDTIMCTNTTLAYDFSFNDCFALDGQAEYSWTANLGSNTYYDSTPTYLIDKPGLYTLQIYGDSICGMMTDQIQVIYNNVEADLGVDITSGICQGDIQTLDATYTNLNFGMTYYQWNTLQISPTINVTQTGTYSVTLTLGDCSSVDSIYVAFDQPLVSPLGGDQFLCPGETDTLDALNVGSTYLWNTGSQNQTLVVSVPGTYNLSVTNACGTITDNITYNPLDVPLVDLGPDITICEGVTEVISGSTGFQFETYEWSTGENTPQIAVTTGGYYSITVTNQCGDGVDQVFVYADQPLLDIFGNDTSVCAGYILDTGQENAEYFWSNGASTQSIEVNQDGNYMVEVTNMCGTYSDEVNLEIITIEELLPANATVCEGESLLLDAGNAGASYLWSTGSMTQTTLVNSPGTYDVTITNLCESVVQEVEVDMFEMTLDLGGDQTICDGQELILDAGHPGSTYAWSTGDQTQSIAVSQSGTYSVTISHPCAVLEDEIALDINPSPSVNFEEDTIITSDPSVFLEPTIDGAIAYTWSTGDISETLLVEETGDYTLTVTNEYGCEDVASIYVGVSVGISGIDLEPFVSIYPNPVKGVLFIETEQIQVRDLAIYSTIGELIQRVQHENGLSRFDTGRLAEGTYFVKIETKEGNMLVKPFTIVR